MSFENTLEELEASMDLTSLKKQRHHVMIVLPLNAKRGEREYDIRSFDIPKDNGDRAGVRDKLYLNFVEKLKPMLAEVVHETEVGKALGLRKLQVPTKAGLDKGLYESTFLVNPDNYFFKRAASNSEHPFWRARSNANSADKAHDKTAGEEDAPRWLETKPHRGKNFVIEVRARLKEFARFLPDTPELLNKFMLFLNKFSSEGGLSALTKDTGFPAGLPERLLDFFFSVIRNPT